MKQILFFITSFVLAYQVSNAQSTMSAVYNIFQEKCIACHGNSSPEAALDLIGNGATLNDQIQEVYNNLIDQDPAHTFANEQGYKRIYPGRVDHSFLFRKISEDFDPFIELDDEETDDVHSTIDPALSDEEKELIRQWILYGAPLNGQVIDPNLITTYYQNGEASFPDGPPPAPDPSEGFQIRMGPFYLEEAGEVEYFQKYELGLPEDVDVDRIDVKISNFSHHFILYRYDEGGANDEAPGLQTEIEHNEINIVASVGQAKDIVLPQGTAFKWASDDVLNLNSHYINYSNTQVYQAEAYLNVYTKPAGTAVQEMRSQLIPNYSIYIPNDGDEHTFTDYFTFWWPEIFIWTMGGHTHQWGTGYQIFERLANGDKGEIYYDGSCPEGIPGCITPYFDYQHIPSRQFDNLLPVNLINGVIHEATYINNGDQPVFWGNTSEDEMMLMGIMYVVDTTGLNLSTPTGVLDPILGDLEVYPNPMQDQTVISFPAGLDRVNFYLMDMMGNRIQSRTGISEPQITLERNHLPPGMYLIRVEDQYGNYLNEKLILR